MLGLDRQTGAPAARGRALLGVSVLAAGASCGGCGLVFIPVVNTYPGPIKAVRVVDCDDRDIPDASVRFVVSPYANWCVFGAGLRPVRSQEAQNGPDGPGRQTLLEGRRREDGSFVFRQRRFWGTVQWFFPLPLPLGWELRRDHAAEVIASAPGYVSACLYFHASNPPKAGWTDYHHPDRAALDDNGLLRLRLVRAGTGQRPMSKPATRASGSDE